MQLSQFVSQLVEGDRRSNKKTFFSDFHLVQFWDKAAADESLVKGSLELHFDTYRCVCVHACVCACV